MLRQETSTAEQTEEQVRAWHGPQTPVGAALETEATEREAVAALHPSARTHRGTRHSAQRTVTRRLVSPRHPQAGPRRLAISLPLLYGVFSLLCVLCLRDPPMSVAFSVVLVLPGILSLVLGILLKRRRMGAAAGVFTFGCMAAGMMTAGRLTNDGPTPSGDGLAALAILLAGGAIVGAFGAFIGAFWQARRERDTEG